MTSGDWKSAVFSRLRCPNCRSDDVAAVSENCGAASETGGYVCRRCAWEMPLREGIVLALPSSMNTAVAANREHYDKIAEKETNILARRAATRNHAIKMNQIKKALRLTAERPCAVLELGAGFGAHGVELIRLGQAYCGLDISEVFLRQARHRFPVLRDAALFAADATRTPFQDEVFDAAFCVATLHHLPEPQNGAQEMIRVLVKGGRFAFLEPKRFYPTHLIQSLRFPETEVSSMKMHVASVSDWVRGAGVSELGVSYCVFTPNGPPVMIPLWEKIDALCNAIKALHVFSVMFCVHGKK